MMRTASALAGQAPVQDVAAIVPPSATASIFCQTTNKMPHDDEGKPGRYHFDSQQDMRVLSKFSSYSNQGNTETEQNKPDFNPRLGSRVLLSRIDEIGYLLSRRTALQAMI
ncbi:MAG TPA: hypothetical protein VI603_13315 [Saprospiraceae bacterium]|nr:hypothetical protein [Saprospiraceae bacterium]